MWLATHITFRFFVYGGWICGGKNVGGWLSSKNSRTTIWRRWMFNICVRHIGQWKKRKVVISWSINGYDYSTNWSTRTICFVVGNNYYKRRSVLLLLSTWEKFVQLNTTWQSTVLLAFLALKIYLNHKSIFRDRTVLFVSITIQN